MALTICYPTSSDTTLRTLSTNSEKWSEINLSKTLSEEVRDHKAKKKARQMAQAMEYGRSGGSDRSLSLNRDGLKVEPIKCARLSTTIVSLKEAQELAEQKGLAGKASKMQNHTRRNPPPVGKNANVAEGILAELKRPKTPQAAEIMLSELRRKEKTSVSLAGSAMTPQQAQALFKAKNGMVDKKLGKDEPVRPKVGKPVTKVKDPIKKACGKPSAEKLRRLQTPRPRLIRLNSIV